MSGLAYSPYRAPPAVAARPSPLFDAVGFGLVLSQCFLLGWCLLRVAVALGRPFTPEGAVAVTFAVVTATTLARLLPTARRAAGRRG